MMSTFSKPYKLQHVSFESLERAQQAFFKVLVEEYDLITGDFPPGPQNEIDRSMAIAADLFIAANEKCSGPE